MCSVPRVLYHHFDSLDLLVEVLSFSVLAMFVVELVLEMIPDLRCELKSDVKHVKLLKHSYVGLVS